MTSDTGGSTQDRKSEPAQKGLEGPEAKEVAELEKERKIALRSVLSVFYLVLVFTALLAGLWVMKKYRPEAKKEQREVAKISVEVVEAEVQDEQVMLMTQGVARSGREVVLTAEVSGKVKRVARKFEVGEMVREGEVLVELEASDYLAAMAQAEANLAQAKLSVSQEEAKAKQAERDWQKLGDGGEMGDLLARRPQLASARAAVSSAQAALDQARRNVERTKIKAPFTGRVRAQSVELGQFVSPGLRLGELFTADEVEVDLPLSLEDYGYLARGGGGEVQGRVRLRAQVGGREYEWSGEILRTSGQIDQQTMTGMVIARIEPNEANPIHLKRPPVGMFLDAEVEGQRLEGVIKLPRLVLLGPDRVAVVSEEGQVSTRKVQVAHSAQGHVLITDGLEAGELVSITRLEVVTEGMMVQVEGPGKEPGAVAGSAEGSGKGGEGGKGGSTQSSSGEARMSQADEQQEEEVP